MLPSDQVRVFPSDPKRQQEALGALAQWAIRFSPVVAADGTDGLLLDVTGCQRLFRGERRLVHQLVDAVRRLGFAVRAASAPSVGCAWAVARFAAEPLSIIEQDQIRDVLGPLPTAGLRLDAGIQAALAQVVQECRYGLIERRQLLAVRVEDVRKTGMIVPVADPPGFLLQPIRGLALHESNARFDQTATR